jgi:transposase
LRTEAGGGGMEIITGVERRRHWRPEEKLRILAELAEPGVKFNDVARRHDLSRGLLWQWRDAWRRGKLVVAEAEPAFVPLRVVPELPAPAEAPGAAASPAPDADRAGEPDDRIEIVLPDGTAVRVTEAVGTAALRRVLAALRG